MRESVVDESLEARTLSRAQTYAYDPWLSRARINKCPIRKTRPWIYESGKTHDREGPQERVASRRDGYSFVALTYGADVLFDDAQLDAAFAELSHARTQKGSDFLKK